MKSRVIWLDSLKGFLIILVVLAHCIVQFIGNDAANNNYWWCLIYSFHMAAFMAVSGYLQFSPFATSKKTLGGQLWRRYGQLLVPFLAWSAIFFTMRGHIEWFPNCIILPNSTFWFLWALFFITVIFLLLKHFSEKCKSNQDCVLSTVCVVFACVLVALKDIHYLGIQYILYYFLFYVMGYFIHKWNVRTENVAVMILLFAIWFLLGSFWRPRTLPDFIPLVGGAATMLRFVYKFVVAAVAVVALFSIASRILNGDNAANRVLVWLGQYSLGIYVIHLTFADVATDIVKNVVCQSWLSILLLFVALMIESAAIVWLLNKNKWTARILLGKF